MYKRFTLKYTIYIVFPVHWKLYGYSTTALGNRMGRALACKVILAGCRARRLHEHYLPKSQVDAPLGHL